MRAGSLVKLDAITGAIIWQRNVGTPAPGTTEGFISADLGTVAAPQKSGYNFTLGNGAGAGAGLATLYTMLYWILRSEDYSLLMGSLLLFGVLAILMIATRRVDWSNVARLKRAGEAA
jgi:hypothetical protein